MHDGIQDHERPRLVQENFRKIMLMALRHGLLLFCLVLILTGCVGFSASAKIFFDGAVVIDPARSRQVIEVAPSKKQIFKATLTAWSYEKGAWKRIFGPWPVVLGRNGFAPLDDKREGDGRTPSGVYALKTAFGRTSHVNTGLGYQQTRDEDIWIDDPASAQYNSWVKKPTQALSFEAMRRADGLYDLGAVIEYNTDPVIPGNGSAIFLHIWRDHGTRPTAGCVALNSRQLRRLLGWLNLDQSPVIVLGRF